MNQHLGLDPLSDPIASTQPITITSPANTNTLLLDGSVPPNSYPRRYDVFSSTIRPQSTITRPYGKNAPTAPAPEVPLNVQYPISPSTVQCTTNGGYQSPIAAHDNRQDSFPPRTYYPGGLTPVIPQPGPHHSRGFSIVNVLPGYRDSIPGLRDSFSGFRDSFSGYRDVFAGPRDSVAGPPLSDSNGKIRTDSIFLPQPNSKADDSDAAFSNSSTKSASWGNGPLRSTSIFSSLIQMPPSTSNSISGQSGTEKLTTMLPIEGKRTLLPVYDVDSSNNNNHGSINWDQMNRGMAGSIASINSENLNQFLASMQNSGSVDLLSTLRHEPRQNVQPISNSPPTNPGARPPMVTTFSSHSLREDIFDEKNRPSRQKGKTSSSGDNPLSPTSSLSSKVSRRTHDDAKSPKALPIPSQMTKMDSSGAVSPGGKRNYRPTKAYEMDPSSTRSNSHYSPPIQFCHNIKGPSKAIEDFRFNPGQFFGEQNFRSHNVDGSSLPVGTGTTVKKPGENIRYETHMNTAMPSQILGSPLQTKQTPNNGIEIGQRDDSHLVSAQQFATAEDGRPLLGATKVDQLMLVIQAREKGNTTTIKQAPDGSIMASPNLGAENPSVLPNSADLVGGISKTINEEPDTSNDGKKARRSKSQQCPYCSKRFNQNTHLYVHVRSHIGYKPFQCTVCAKRFTQGGNLRTHMRLHTGEKPFSCSVCDRSFSRKGNLAAHMLTHNKEKPFLCRLDECGKTFTQLGNLKSHQNKFHLPTLTRLTQYLANLSGEALEQLPSEEKELLDYFSKLYKNSNKGIRGRGKGNGVTKFNEGFGTVTLLYHPNTSNS